MCTGPSNSLKGKCRLIIRPKHDLHTIQLLINGTLNGRLNNSSHKCNCPSIKGVFCSQLYALTGLITRNKFKCVCTAHLHLSAIDFLPFYLTPYYYVSVISPFEILHKIARLNALLSLVSRSSPFSHT